MDVRKAALRVAQGDEPQEGQYGGRGPFALPADHVAAIRVPKGGSCCANCSFVDAENHACQEPNYASWNGDASLPPDLALDEICSDWYSPAAGTVEPG